MKLCNPVEVTIAGDFSAVPVVVGGGDASTELADCSTYYDLGSTFIQSEQLPTQRKCQ